MDARNFEDVYAVSPIQRALLTREIPRPGSGSDCRQLRCKLSGNLDLPALELAWLRVLERHSILRTSFVWKRLERPLQVVHRKVDFSLGSYDWRQSCPGHMERHLDDFMEQELREGIDPSTAPLMRVSICRIGDDAYYLVGTFHSLVVDRRSLVLSLKEVFACYENYCGGSDLKLVATPPYWNYIDWLDRQDVDGSEAFWSESLKGVSNPTSLMTGRIASHLPDRRKLCEVEHFALSPELAESLKTLSRRCGLGFNTLIEGAWALLLSRYSGQQDVVFGVTVSGRPEELEGSQLMMGPLENTLPVRVQISGGVQVLSWLRGLESRLADLRRYQFTPLSQAHGWTDIPQGLPLFESQVIPDSWVDRFEERPYAGVLVSDVEISPREESPIHLKISGGLEPVLSIACEAGCFDAGALRRMIDHLRAILEEVASLPDRKIDSLLGVPEPELRLLIEWNRTATDYRRHGATIQELLEKQAEMTPDRVALIYEAENVSYSELNRRANQLACHLRRLGVGLEDRVAICVERSVEMMVGILGILKAGGAYVPLDPDYPERRQRFILENAAVTVVLTQERLLGALTSHARVPVCLDSHWEAIAEEGEENLNVPATPENLAYVMYTSGSTGTPKGALIPHQGVIRLVKETGYAELTDEHIFLQLAPLPFDASTFEIWGALLNGAVLNIMPAGRLSPDRIGDVIRTTRVTTLWLTAALFDEMIDRQVDALAGVSQLLAGGDVLSPTRVKRYLKRHEQPVLINGYGPTENTTFTSTFRMRSVDSIESFVPIGRPIANTRIYLVDDRMTLLPIGVAGELLTGGAGLARGYLNRPELTAERFVPDLYGTEPGGRLYRTGDFARYRPEGEIEFLGRRDLQVKIRGFRIELQEIEEALRSEPEVKQAVVLVKEQDGDKKLMAYLVWGGQPHLSTTELRQRLSQKLPAYMTPQSFVTLNEMPMTPNGKIDRRALPEPASQEAAHQENFVAPRSPVEEMLAGVWGDLLGYEQVGVHDNFFESGGHSLLATRLASRAKDLFQVDLPLRTVFEHPTIEALAGVVEQGRRPGSSSIEVSLWRAPRDLALPLSYAQERLWFLDLLDPGNAFYNVPFALQLSGPLDLGCLEQAFSELIRRHEVLRTTFLAADGLPLQVISSSFAVGLPLVDLSGLGPDERHATSTRLLAEEAKRDFNLSEGPLLRIGVIRLDAHHHILHLTLHHIVCDGWSVGIMVNEVTTLYNAYLKGEASPLRELDIQYADFASWQREWLEGDELERQMNYWRGRLAGAPPLLELPSDRPRPVVQSYRGGAISFEISEELTSSLKRLGRRHGATLYMTLLTAVNVLLHRHSGQNDIVVGTPIANRNRVEIEGLIGLFVNTLVMRTALSRSHSFLDVLKEVREAALEAYAHQDLPFEKLVERLQPERSLSHSPLFQVMMSLDNQPSTGMGLGGVKVTMLRPKSQVAKFDLSLGMIEGAGRIEGSMEYSHELFDRETIERMIGHFRVLLERVAAAADQPVSDIVMLTGAEEEQLKVWNQTQIDRAETRCIHELYERQVEMRPDAVAVAFAECRMSYGELNRRANKLAWRLKTKGIGPEALVGIFIERGIEMVVSLLAVLKAGGAYLPLDPSYPARRLEYMLSDSGARLLISQSSLLDRLPSREIPVLWVDANREDVGEDAEWNPTPPEGLNLAYALYTSGSTGTPKGVAIQHTNAAALSTWAGEYFGVEKLEGVLGSTSLCFDLSVFELLVPLSLGGRVIVSENVLQLEDLAEKMEVKLVNTVPSVMAELLRSSSMPRSVETVNLAGEQLSKELVRELYGRESVKEVINLYGPSEDTTYSTGAIIKRDFDGQPPIGRPLRGTRAYILDQRLNAVPVGVKGEIYIAGDGQARGYLKRPELTAERFIPDPFCKGQAGRMYKTGDVAKFLSDGEIEFLGREDDQVKVRGFRIELGEIEAVLRQSPQVIEAAVVPQQDDTGATRLVAYILANDEVLLDVNALREVAREKLPEYMVPNVYVKLQELPLTPSGKIDRRALPAHDRVNVETAAPALPRDTVELRLAQIWEEILGSQRFGLADSFFDVGGHSLTGVRLMVKIERDFGVKLPITSLFRWPTIEGLSRLIRSKGARSAGSSLVAIRLRGNKQPFFCIHPAGGNVLCYAALARHLDSDRPFYGLQAQGLDDEQPVHGRIEAMAAHYVALLRQVQPDGPYYLGGWSMGGVVAFEMARQFEQRGDDVALLVLIDTRNPLLDQDLQAADEPSLLEAFALQLGVALDNQVAGGEMLSRLDPQSRLPFILELAKTLKAVPGEIDLVQLQKLFDVFSSNIRALRDYVPQTRRGRIVLLKAGQHKQHRRWDSTLGWRGLATEGVDVYEVPGNHFSIMRPPYVKDLAERLASCLRSTAAVVSAV